MKTWVLFAFNSALIGLLTWASTALAQSRDFKTLGINLLGRQYTMQQKSTDPVQLTPMQQAELSFRLYKLYHFSLIGMKSTDNNRNGYGAGIRVNLPGYFLIGSKLQDLTRDSKLYPVNTSIYGFAIRTNMTKEDGSLQTTMLAQYGGTLDIFLFNRYTYITLDLGIHTLLGDSTWIYGAGLGFQF